MFQHLKNRFECWQNSVSQAVWYVKLASMLSIVALIAVIVAACWAYGSSGRRNDTVPLAHSTPHKFAISLEPHQIVYFEGKPYLPLDSIFQL